MGLAILPWVGAIHELPLPKVGTRVDLYIIKSSFLIDKFESEPTPTTFYFIPILPTPHSFP
jgi:hypothetical protein